MGITKAPPFPKVTVVDSDSAARKAVEALQRDTLIGLDTETNKLQQWDQMVSFQYSNGHNAVFVPTKYLDPFRKPLMDGKLKKVFHNGPYDLEQFKRLDCSVEDGFHGDTLVMDWLIDENLYKYGLEQLAMHLFEVHLESLEDLFGVIPPGKKKPQLPPLQAVYDNAATRKAFVNYSAKDPFYTYHAFMTLKTMLKREGIYDYYRAIEAPFTVTLWRMTRRGIQLNLPLLKEIGNQVWFDQCRAKHLFFAAIGKDVNLNSPKQLIQLFINELKWPVLKHTKGSTKKFRAHGDADLLTPALDNEVLEAYAEEGRKLAELLVEHRRADKQVGSFILPFFTKCDKFGVIRSDFNQIGTVTGRLSSRTPNLQNVPAREEKDPHKIRRVFRARKGKKLIVADYGGIELRVMAHESQDEHMVASFMPGSPTEDLHSLTAQKLFPHLKNKSLAEIKEHFGDERAKGKSMNFLIQYGGQGGKAAQVIGCSPEEGQEYIDTYLEFYEGVAAFMSKCVSEAYKRGYVKTLAGRRRHIPELKGRDPDAGRKTGVQLHAERQAMNSPIQGGAADLLKLAMVTLDRDPVFKKFGWAILLQVHDELVCEGPEETAKEALPIITHHMEKAGVTLKMRVPLKAVAKIGDNWNAAK